MGFGFDQHTAERFITQGKQQSKHYYASIIRHKLCTESWKKMCMRMIFNVSLLCTAGSCIPDLIDSLRAALDWCLEETLTTPVQC